MALGIRRSEVTTTQLLLTVAPVVSDETEVLARLQGEFRRKRADNSQCAIRPDAGRPFDRVPHAMWRRLTGASPAKLACLPLTIKELAGTTG